MKTLRKTLIDLLKYRDEDLREDYIIINYDAYIDEYLQSHPIETQSAEEYINEKYINYTERFGNPKTYIFDKEDLIDFLEEFANQQIELPPIPTIDQFNRIEDLRPYLLRHPDKEMIKDSCLHYLGDEFQKKYQQLIKNK